MGKKLFSSNQKGNQEYSDGVRIFTSQIRLKGSTKWHRKIDGVDELGMGGMSRMQKEARFT